MSDEEGTGTELPAEGSWVVDGFDPQTEELVDTFELPGDVTDDQLAAVLGADPREVRYGSWPATPGAVELIRQVTGRVPDTGRCNYFFAYYRSG